MRTRGILIVVVLASLLTAFTPPDAQAAVPHALKHNRLDRAKPITGHGCVYPSLPLDSMAHATALAKAVVACLNRDWKPVVKSAHVRFTAPKLRLWSGKLTRSKPCRPLGAATPFYCPPSHTIYLPPDGWTTAWNDYPTDDAFHRYLYLNWAHLVAHEYGHHVQRLTGILGSRGQIPGARSKKAAKAAGLRLELQATCLGDEFLAAEQSAFPISPAEMADVGWAISPPEDHGHGTQPNQTYWIQRGRASSLPKACNTWTVPVALAR